MHLSRSVLVFLLGSAYISATGIHAAETANATPRCLPSHSNDCSSSTSTPGSTLPLTTPQATPPPAADDTFETQTILHPPDTTFVPLQQTGSPHLTPNRTPGPPSPPNPAQTPFSNPTIPQPPEGDFSISPFDREQCLQQKYCLICMDPTTTLTCYKFNCQCQRGTPMSHYMPASQQSCYKAELCLSCPSGSTPFSWGRMAVCLTIFQHKPVKGEGNPLTNWTEEGVRSLPVGKAEMNVAGMGRKVPGVVGVAGLGLVASMLLQLD